MVYPNLILSMVPETGIVLKGAIWGKEKKAGGKEKGGTERERTEVL